MKLIIATTPYNIFNALILKEQFLFDEEVDLYITDFAAENLKIADRIREQGKFSSIHIIKQYKYDHTFTKSNNNKFKKLFLKVYYKFRRIFFKKACYKEVCGFISNKKYDGIFLDVGNYPQRVVMDYHYKYNKSMKTNIYEVGHETAILIEKLCGTKKETDKVYKSIKLKNMSKIYVHNPELYYNLNDKVSFVKFGEIAESTKKIINEAFDYKADYNGLFENKYIYFDSTADDYVALEKQYIDIVSNIQTVSGNLFCVKLHPRREKDVFVKLAKTYDYQVPMELLLLNSSNIDDKVFVSHISVSTFTPKTLFNKEPTVILLYKIIKDDRIGPEGMKDLNIIFEKTREYYSDKSKFIAPETMNEFLSIIKNIYSESV